MHGWRDAGVSKSQAGKGTSSTRAEGKPTEEGGFQPLVVLRGRTSAAKATIFEWMPRHDWRSSPSRCRDDNGFKSKIKGGGQSLP
jgi:hypothetical protein